MSLPVQTAALVGVGLLYQGSTHRFMSELLLGELGRSPSDEHCTNREGYAWAAGVALGLVCLGRGTSAQGLADLRLDDKLYAYMMGAPRANLFDSTDLDPDVMHDPDQAMEVIMRRKEPATTSQCSRILEGRLVNVSVTGAGATMALALMYLMTNNESVAARLAGGPVLQSLGPLFGAYGTRSELCLVFGLRDRGGGDGSGGMRAKKSVYLKWASQLWLFIQNFTLLQRKIFLVLGGGVGGWAWGGGPARCSPPSPPPVRG